MGIYRYVLKQPWSAPKQINGNSTATACLPPFSIQKELRKMPQKSMGPNVVAAAGYWWWCSSLWLYKILDPLPVFILVRRRCPLNVNRINQYCSNRSSNMENVCMAIYLSIYILNEELRTRTLKKPIHNTWIETELRWMEVHTSIPVLSTV